MEPQPRGTDRKSSQDLFRDLWSQALLTVGAAEDEARRLLDRLAEAVEIQPEELQRYRRELTERLRSQRKELEKSVEEGIRKALGRLKIPSREEVDSLASKVDSLASRLDRLVERRKKSTPGEK